MSGEGMVPNAEGRLMVMRIVHGALVAGCLTFAAIAVFMPMDRGGQPNQMMRMLVYVGYGFAALIALAYAVVPNMMAAGWRRSIARGTYPLSSYNTRYGARYENAPPPPPLGSAAHWWGLYQTRMIIGAALLEGCIFYQLIAYLLTREPTSLIIAALFLIVLAAMFPTRSRVEHWVTAQQELVDQVKRTGA